MEEALTGNKTLYAVGGLCALLILNVSIAAYYLSGPRPEVDAKVVKPRRYLSPAARQGLRLRGRGVPEGAVHPKEEGSGAIAIPAVEESA